MNKIFRDENRILSKKELENIKDRINMLNSLINLHSDKKLLVRSYLIEIDKLKKIIRLSLYRLTKLKLL